MNYAGLAVEAPFLDDSNEAAITEFFKKRTDYLFSIRRLNTSLDNVNKIIPTSLVASIDNDLLATIYAAELEIFSYKVKDGDL